MSAPSRGRAPGRGGGLAEGTVGLAQQQLDYGAAVGTELEGLGGGGPGSDLRIFCVMSVRSTVWRDRVWLSRRLGDPGGRRRNQGPGIGGVGEGGSGVSFGMGHVCPRLLLRKRGLLPLSDQILSRISQARVVVEDDVRPSGCCNASSRSGWPPSSVSYDTRAPLIPSTVTVQSSPHSLHEYRHQTCARGSRRQRRGKPEADMVTDRQVRATRATRDARGCPPPCQPRRPQGIRGEQVDVIFKSVIREGAGMG